MSRGPDGSPTSIAGHPTEDQLIDVAHGLADGDGRRAVLLHLTSCPPCEALFLSIAGERELLRASSRPRVRSGEVVMTEPPNPVPRRARSLRWAVFAAAAVLTAVALVPRLRSDRPAIAEHWLPREPAYRYLRASGGEEASALVTMLDAYEQRDVSRALGLLEPLQLDDDDALRTLTYIYRADLLLRQRRAADEALRLLESIDIATVPPPWRGEARWIRYVALRLEGDEEQAMQALTGLQDATGELGELAREERARLLEAINRLRPGE